MCAGLIVVGGSTTSVACDAGDKASNSGWHVDCPVVSQEDLSETTPAVEPLCRVLLADPQPQELQQHIPQMVQVSVLR